MKHNLKDVESAVVNPLISIIVPVYKTPRSFLTDCIKSIQNQTYKNLEIIIVNDGGEDYNFCLGFAKDDERILVINQKNSGVSAARNTGVKAARGTWCIFVDSDDWIENTMCADALKAAKDLKASNNVEADLIFWPYRKEYNKKSETVCFFKSDFSALTAEDCLQLQKQVLCLTSGLGSVWAKMYRLDFIREAGVLFNTELSLGEDIEFNFRLFRSLKSAVYIHKFNYRYRYDEGTVSNAFNTAFADKHELFAHSLYAAVEKSDDVYKQTFLSLIYARIIHSILAVALRYCFHPDNPAAKNEKLQEFKRICSRPVFKQAIKEASYDFFPIERKTALFFLKHKVYRAIRFIAYIRSIQYKLKCKIGEKLSKS